MGLHPLEIAILRFEVPFAFVRPIELGKPIQYQFAKPGLRRDFVEKNVLQKDAELGVIAGVIGQCRAFAFNVADDPVAKRAKGQRVDVYAGPFLDAFCHLGGRIFAEGKEQDFVRFADAAFDEIGGLGDDDTGLA